MIAVIESSWLNGTVNNVPNSLGCFSLYALWHKIRIDSFLITKIIISSENIFSDTSFN